MDDGHIMDREPNSRFRRTPPPQMGHGELTRLNANRYGAMGARDMATTAMDRFNARFGNIGPITARS